MRQASGDRRTQIVETTLQLLATTPLESITTRQIANELDLSQPALFRHFRTKDALLLAVVEYARAALEVSVQENLAHPGTASELLIALGVAFARQAKKMPGVPRLLLAEASLSASKLRAALKSLLAAPLAVFAELVRQGQREGAYIRDLDPEVVASALVALIQGAALQWQLQDRTTPLPEHIRTMFAFTLRGLERNPEEKREEPPVASAPKTCGIEMIDARKLLAEAIEPLPIISEAVEKMGNGGVVIVVAPFEPRPLMALLKGRGHGISARQGPHGSCIVEVVVGGTPEVADFRELEPPEPLERTLVAIRGLAPGEVFLARLPRYPALLVAHLATLPVKWRAVELEDETALLRVAKNG